MKAILLLDLLEGRLDPAAFEAAVRKEVDAYRARCEIKGASAPVVFAVGANRVVIRSPALEKLLVMYQDTRLTSWSLRYICEALVLSDYSEKGVLAEEWMRDILETLSDVSLSDEELRAEAARALSSLSAGQAGASQAT